MRAIVSMDSFPSLSRNKDTSERSMPASVCSLATYSGETVRRSALVINTNKTHKRGI